MACKCPLAAVVNPVSDRLLTSLDVWRVTGRHGRTVR